MLLFLAIKNDLFIEQPGTFFFIFLFISVDLLDFANKCGRIISGIWISQELLEDSS